MSSNNPIGMFDSGVGGLSVLRHVLNQLPNESVIYVADQAYIPYGQKSAEVVRERSRRITKFLLAQQCKLIAVPCNTASAAALDGLREQFPDVPFVGIEPAVKPGARATQSGKVGVLATEGTFGSERYAALMERFAANVDVIENSCAGLVDLIEAGKANSDESLRLLRPILHSMLTQGVDTFVLGCTHYPFARNTIRRIVGQEVIIIDPAPAIARQIQAVLQQHDLLSIGDSAQISATTTGDMANFLKQIETLIGAELDNPVQPIIMSL